MWTNFSFVNNFESPSLKCALCQVWWNGPSGSGEKMFKRRHVFPLSLFLWKERGPSFQHNGILLTQRCSVPGLVEYDPVVLEKKMKIRKVYRWMDEKRGQEAIKWARKGNRLPTSTVGQYLMRLVYSKFFLEIHTSLNCGILEVLFVKDQLLNANTWEKYVPI